MKIKRTFAPDLRQALRKVREEQGPDAVILSNKKVDGGVELVSAIDYDEKFIAAQIPLPEVDPESQIETSTASTTSDLSLRVNTKDTPYVEQVVHSARTPDMGQGDIDSTQAPLGNSAFETMNQEIRALRNLVEGQLTKITWNQMKSNQPGRIAILRRLMEMGFDGALSEELSEAAGSEQDQDKAWSRVENEITKRIPIAQEDLIDRGGVIAMVGPTGVGKTTSIAKLAARFCLRHGARHLALITTDSYRIGAHEQLFNYGRILDVPVRVASSHEELQQTLASFSDKRLVLIDTAGMSYRDSRLKDQFDLLACEELGIDPYLVMSATTNQSSLTELVRSFGRFNPKGCVLTKLDETGTMGNVLTSAIESDLPIAYFCDGQKVPEDLHRARSRDLLGRCLSVAQESPQHLNEESLVMTFGGAIANARV